MFRVISEPNIEYKENIRFLNPIAEQDPYYPNVQLYLKGDVVGGQVTDSSLFSSSNTISNSNVTISNTQSKYGGASFSVGSGADKYIQVASTEFSALGNIWTFEAWVYTTSFTGVKGIFFHGTTTSNEQRRQLGTISGTGNIRLFIRNNTSDLISLDSSNALSLNQWNHVAACQNGSVAYVAVNGTVTSGNLSSTTITLSNNIFVGTFRASSVLNGWNGFIDSFRLTKGVARYTANFNPETDTYLAY